MKLKSNLGADAAILLTTLVWGSTFAVARGILDAWPPLSYLALRLPAAALLFVALFPRQVFGASRQAWRAGTTLGLLIGLSLTGQTAGLLWTTRSEEHTSELQSLAYLVCRLLLEKKKKIKSELTFAFNNNYCCVIALHTLSVTVV